METYIFNGLQPASRKDCMNWPRVLGSGRVFGFMKQRQASAASFASWSAIPLAWMCKPLSQFPHGTFDQLVTCLSEQ